MFAWQNSFFQLYLEICLCLELVCLKNFTKEIQLVFPIGCSQYSCGGCYARHLAHRTPDTANEPGEQKAAVEGGIFKNLNCTKCCPAPIGFTVPILSKCNAK